MQKRKRGIYEKYIKRCLDFLLSLFAILILSPVILITALLVRVKLGSPVLFCQIRPGKSGKLFRMYKFRSMTDERDESGELLPDDVRLTPFGKKLRATSLDELPELFNILKGDMSIVGPRPQLVRDMVFMTPEQNRRHEVRQGLTGLAQVKGRNSITWEEKLAYDIEYVNHISFWNDLKIILGTVKSVFAKEGISAEGMETAEDFGDYLLRIGKIDDSYYARAQQNAREMIDKIKEMSCGGCERWERLKERK